jgi:hypothetical protein
MVCRLLVSNHWIADILVRVICLEKVFTNGAGLVALFFNNPRLSFLKPEVRLWASLLDNRESGLLTLKSLVEKSKILRKFAETKPCEKPTDSTYSGSTTHSKRKHSPVSSNSILMQFVFEHGLSS